MGISTSTHTQGSEESQKQRKDKVTLLSSWTTLLLPIHQFYLTRSSRLQDSVQLQPLAFEPHKLLLQVRVPQPENFLWSSCLCLCITLTVVLENPDHYSERVNSVWPSPLRGGVAITLTFTLKKHKPHKHRERKSISILEEQ